MESPLSARMTATRARRTREATPRVQKRYGIGEWFGVDLSHLPQEAILRRSTAAAKSLPCPFQSNGKMCSKKGGVCSFRLYQRTGNEAPEPVANSPLVSLCPSRFLEDETVFKWVGETLLGTSTPAILTELPFLLSTHAIPDQADEDPGAVGRIDMVLVNQESPGALKWCALEMQAVYFSGPAMSKEFTRLRTCSIEDRMWPSKIRRPDFRSSGPKRLMPQLQIKVPTISRWGKKMAVVIDKAFWMSLAPMTEVNHGSNCDIAWFVVDFIPVQGGKFQLVRDQLHLTTLDRAVEGLTGGIPTSLEAFESTIREKLG
jgi:hypothetical protein